MSKVPFFSDFTKRTKDFFDPEKYDLGQTVEATLSCGDDLKFKTKVQNGPLLKTKFTATYNRDGREVEVTEDLRKGLNVKVTLPKFYRNFDIDSEHCNSDVKVTAKYNPKDSSFWNTKISGYYNPDCDGYRVCKTTAQFAVGDDQLKLSVGGEVVVEDRARNNANPRSGVEPNISTYSLGFLYRPTDDTQYSVLYTPDEKSNGMDYSFTCFRQMSEKCALAARATGKVDTNLGDDPPTIAIAGGWKVNANYLQAYIDSRKQWGFSYKVNVSATATLTLGVSSFLNKQEREAITRFGYKFSV
jgi:hypothetical protein